MFPENLGLLLNFLIYFREKERELGGRIRGRERDFQAGYVFSMDLNIGLDPTILG